MDRVLNRSHVSLSPRFVVLDQVQSVQANQESPDPILEEFKKSLGQQRLNFVSFEAVSPEIEDMLGKLAKSIGFENYNMYYFSEALFSEEILFSLKQILKEQNQVGNFILFSIKPTITLSEKLSDGVYLQTHALNSLNTNIEKKKELWMQMKKAFNV